MRHEEYKGSDITVMREFDAVEDGHNLLNALSDDAKPIVLVEITLPNGQEISRRLPIDNENTGMMFAYRIVDEWERRRASV